MSNDPYADLNLSLPPEWTLQAICAQTDPEAFFPSKGGDVKRVKAMCGRCEVRQQCLDYSLANKDEYGVFGGTTSRERRKLRKEAA